MRTISREQIFKVNIGEVQYYVIPGSNEVTVISIYESHISCGVAQCGAVSYDNIHDIIISYELNKENYEKKLSR